MQARQGAAINHMMQNAAVDTLGYGHLAYDVFAAIFLAKGVIDLLKFMGFIPARLNGNGTKGMPLESLKLIVREEVRDTMQPILLQLTLINNGIIEMVAILKERRS